MFITQEKFEEMKNDPAYLEFFRLTTDEERGRCLAIFMFTAKSAMDKINGTGISKELYDEVYAIFDKCVNDIGDGNPEPDMDTITRLFSNPPMFYRAK